MLATARDRGTLLSDAVLHFVQALARCITRDEVASALKGHVEVFGASSVGLALVGRDLTLRVWAARGSDFTEGASISLDSAHPLAQAARIGRGQLGSVGGESPVDVLAVPLVAPSGRAVIGSIGLTFSNAADLVRSRFLVNFLAEEIACALQRGSVLEGERALRARAQQSIEILTHVQAVTAGLCGAREPEDVADIIVATGMAELGADGGTLYLVADHSREPVALRHLGDGPESTTTPEVVASALRTGRPVFASGAAGSKEDAGSCAVIPVKPKDRVIGAILFRFREAHDFNELDRSAMASLASQCAQALERASLYAARAEEARLLQQRLLPSRLPIIPGVEAAARYRSFGDGSIVGGDFYDVFPAGPQRWGLTIGDVCGKGIPAASMTSLARHAIRALSTLQESPAEILRGVNDIVLAEGIEGSFCTVVHGFLHPRADGSVKIRMAVAGHPRPLVLSPSGAFREVGAYGTLIGAVEDPLLQEDEFDLAPGESIILYTDGFIEARSPQGLIAPDLIQRAIAGLAGQGAERIADAIETAALTYQGGNNRDDMALLVLRATGGGAHEG